MKILYDLTNYIENSSIRIKHKLFYSLLIILPLIVIGSVVCFLMKNILQNQIITEGNKDAFYSAMIIEKVLDEVDVQVLTNLWNKEVLSFLNESASNLPDPEAAKKELYIENILMNIANSRKEIEFLMIKTTDGKRYFYSSENLYPIYIRFIKDLPEEIYSLKKISHSQICWIGFDGKRDSILGIRKIIDKKDLQELGYLYIGLRNEFVSELYQPQKTTSGSFYIIYDQLGNSVSNELIDNNYKVNIENCYTYYDESIRSGWKIIQYIPKWDINREILKIFILISSFTLILIILTLILMHRFSDYIILPLIQLSNLMGEVQKDNFEIRANIRTHDEVGELAESFNHMLIRINKMIEEEYKAKLLLQETEYKYLQAQINPHFLYNTLDSISWMASLSGNYQISKMSVALGKVLRWAISDQSKRVKLIEEIENVEEYLSIQKVRYGDELQYKINVCGNVSESAVIKMVLQPIVENALIHGLTEVDHIKLVVIKAWNENDQLIIEIRDNGVGITSERITEIMNGMAETHIGVGLFNVHRRIKMAFGDEYGLFINSVVGEGTSVKIVMPIERREVYD